MQNDRLSIPLTVFERLILSAPKNNKTILIIKKYSFVQQSLKRIMSTNYAILKL